jgi:cell shape-determining protein MreC
MSKQDLATENQVLREENTRLAVRAALYDEVIAERDRIFERFGRDPMMTGVLTRVVAAPSRSPYDVILIDAGTDDGISEGDEAWFDTTLMLGTVESVSSNAARVRLFSSPGVETPVIVGTSTEALFTAIGSGGGAFEVSIPKDIPVTVGDALMLPTEGHGTLGFVREVTSHDTDSFQTVRVILPINLFETREVLIRPVGR